MREAITQLNYNPASFETRGEDAPADRELILQGTYLRDILLRSFVPSAHVDEHSQDDYMLGDYNEDLPLDPPYPTTDSKSEQQDRGSDAPAAPPLPLDGLFRKDARIQSWARRYSSVNPVVIEGDPVLANLNPTQVRAVAMMLDNRFTLVQGVRPCFPMSFG